MYLDTDQDISSHVFIIDPNIHKKSKLSRDEFLKRVSHVKQIRTCLNEYYISFYITSLEEYCNLKRFHDIVNLGKFDFKDLYCLAITVEPLLYDWFRNTQYTVLEKQIVFWLTSLYFFTPNKRHILKKQLYGPLFEEIQKLIDQYYKNFDLPDFQTLEERLIRHNDETIFDEANKCRAAYLDQCLNFYGKKPPEFLQSPFDYKCLKDWGINDSYSFQFVQTYFQEEDWNFIILKGGKDDMGRAESRTDLWVKWKHTFATYDQRKSPVFTFLHPAADNKALKKSPREVIQQHVKDQVWRRDEGKCVACGSNEKLEFDHIIPVAKGGSSTYRNLQLLCEPCNRKKSTKLGIEYYI